MGLLKFVLVGMGLEHLSHKVGSFPRKLSLLAFELSFFSPFT